MASSNRANINRWSGKAYSEKCIKILEKRKKLAIWQHRDEFLNAFRANQVLALVAQTGSGKSTQIPQFILDDMNTSSKRTIACTQPQKVAVMSAAHRVAEEMGVTIGEEIGYRIKFEDCTSSRTVLKYVQDDMLLKEAMTDPLLQRYKVIIIDDIQERTLANDLLLGYLSPLLTKRPDLKLVFMTSASLESEKFKNYFRRHYPSIHIMNVPERLHPVEIVYNTHEELDRNNYLEDVIKIVVNIHRHEPHGDVLVFLSEEEEVEHACNKISKEISKLGDLVGPVKLVPLYSCLPATMQHKIYEETCGRKIVVTTDIVESSLTIDGISYVVDSGFVRKKIFDPKLNMESLVMSAISKASAAMRSEHAGRSTSDGRRGKCFRLYTEESYNNLDQETCPEILRLNLANMILSFQKLGLDDFLFYGYVDYPDIESIVRAFETLVDLGALDKKNCQLTNIGDIMIAFPLEPQMAKMLVVSPQFNCPEDILSISSMLSVPNCIVGSKEEQKEVKAKFHNINDGDHLTLLNIYRAFKQNKEDLSWCNDNFINYWTLKEADNIRQELASIMMDRFSLNLCSTEINNSVNITKSILAGYFMQVAHLDTTGNYITLEGNKVVNFHPSSNGLDDQKPEWVVFNEFAATEYNFIPTVTTICGEWLIDSAAPWSWYYKLSAFSNSEAKHILERLRVYVPYARMLKERKLTDGKLGKHANISTFHRLLPYHNKRKRKERA